MAADRRSGNRRFESRHRARGCTECGQQRDKRCRIAYIARTALLCGHNRKERYAQAVSDLVCTDRGIRRTDPDHGSAHILAGSHL